MAASVTMNGYKGHHSPPMPWFGMDIGGTLTKVVYFEPADPAAAAIGGGSNGHFGSKEDLETSTNIHKYLTTNRAYGDQGHRDEHLQIDGVGIGGFSGSIHFIRFPTSQMNGFIKIAKDKGLAKLASTVCATGGGAYKFEADFMRELGLRLHKFDELETLIEGLELVVKIRPEGELFYYEDPQNAETGSIKRPFSASRSFEPFILVNIGSGVSILSVKGPNDYQRVYGTSLGGGTFLGLCCLLTGCKTFEEALKLASTGDHRNVDKLVKDIYGGDYDKFHLSGDTVASSFGQMNLAEKRMLASKEDLARATLVMITNNIGSLTRLCARLEGIERVLFVGNFLRINEISMKQLAFAMDYWSKGAMKALFCEHEGYCGAVGCLHRLMILDDMEEERGSWSPHPVPSGLG